MLSTAFFACFPALASAAIDENHTLRYDPPVESAQVCDGGDFGTVQIRIGLHSSLQACYKNVSATGKPHHRGTAFITIPREFEGRSVSLSDFHLLRDDIVKSENEIYENALAARAGKKPVAKAKPEPVPLGIFDHDTHRVGYAYAFAVPRTDANGKAYPQAMIRLESFVLVGDKVVVLMMITPVQTSEDAAETFNLSEAWARAIIALNENPAQPTSHSNSVSESSSKKPATSESSQKSRGKNRRIHQLS
ncbi:MAG: hypothetical protein AB8C46_14645 [Burkholderiaceae bacterium]